MANDHEDYETGAAPAAHKVSHQDGGTDEISVAGLSGETLTLAAHKILPAIHHIRFTAAEARAAINNIFGSDGKADVDINLDTHKLINVVDPVADQDGDTKKARNDAISTHAGVATAHQDAPGLILTHKGDASAHHAYITGTWTPIFISTGASFSYISQYGWFRKLGSLVIAQFYLLASASGTVTNPLTLGGLPYTQSNVSLSHGAGIVGFFTFTTIPTLVGTPNTTYFTIYEQGTTTALTPTTAGLNIGNRYFQGTLICVT